jgi:putative transcriptional regulator
MTDITKGIILVAMPTLLDPNFRQTVVLLCEHGAEGSMGLVLNRPTTVQLATLLPEVELWPGQTSALGEGFDKQVYVGGPVQTNALMMLYRGSVRPGGGENPAWLPVLEDIHLTGDLQAVEGVEISAEPIPRIRFYLGYAGWAPGQLEAEVKAGGWKMLPGDPEIIFPADPILIWPTMIKTFGKEFAVYADMPPDPHLN